MSVTSKCLETCNRILELLKLPPDDNSYWEWVDGKRTWTDRELRALCSPQFVTIYDDALAKLCMDLYVVVVNKNHIRITDSGRIFQLTGGYDINDDSVFGLHGKMPIETANLPERQFPEVAFIKILSNIQQQQLLEFLNEKKWVNKPRSFVDFLIGKNRGGGVEIIPGSEIAISYLVYTLKQSKLIKLNFENAYQQYVESQIRTFSQKKEKLQIKNNITKVKRNHRLKTTIGKDIERLVSKIKK